MSGRGYLFAMAIGVGSLAVGSLGCIAETDPTVPWADFPGEVDESVGEAGDELEVDVAQDANDDAPLGDAASPGGDGSPGDDVADPEPDPWAPKPPTWYTDPEPDPWDPWGAPERAFEADQAHQS